MDYLLNWWNLEMAIVIMILAISPIPLECQDHGLRAYVPEELDILIKNDQIKAINVYFTGPPREYDRIENKLIHIFRINRANREIRELSMDYDSYYGYWTLFRFDENWNIIEERKYKEDTIVYSTKEYTYNDQGDIIEEYWVNTINEDKVFSPYLHRKLIFQEQRVIQRTRSWRSKNPQPRNRFITDVFNRRGRLKKRFSTKDTRKMVTLFDSAGREKKVRIYHLDTLTNRFSLQERRRYKYEYDSSEERLVEEVQTKKDSLVRISRREYLNDTLIRQATFENGSIVFEQHRIYTGNLLIERKIRGRGDDNFSVYGFEYVNN